MKIIDTFGLPEAVVNAVKNDKYDRGEPLEGTVGIYTPSSMSTPPQVAELYRQYDDEIEEEAVTRVWSLLGSSVHNILELGAEHAGHEYAEERMFAKLEVPAYGIYTISGMIDNRAPLEQAINDYKVTSVWTIINGGRDEWIDQLNIYAWLIRQNGGEVERLRIFALLRDWSWREALKSDRYPSTPIIEWPIIRKNDDMIEAHMRARIAVHEDARSGRVEPCSDEDRWATEKRYALRKVGRKGAIKVEDALEDIAAYTAKRFKVTDVATRVVTSGFGVDATGYDELFEKDQYYIEERLSEQIRCARYCSVVQYCEQAKELNVKPTMRAYGRAHG